MESSHTTEHQLPGTESLHRLSPEQILTVFEQQDEAVSRALCQARPQIEALGRAMCEAFARGGRVIHVGAGTSGRLGVVDAAEWPPTFGVEPDRVVGVMAGGTGALFEAVEGAEDQDSHEAMAALEVSERDLVNGISASGGARFVRSALHQAQRVGAARSWISTQSFVTQSLNNQGRDVQNVDSETGVIEVVLDTGPEVLAGSTRLKAATATQMVLQRASNVCAVLSGWVYAGRMVNMKPTNRKLRTRAVRIVAEIGDVEEGTARQLLEAASDEIKTAIVCARRQCSPTEARAALSRANGTLARLEGFA